MSEFRPPGWLANRHLQSILPSLPFRRAAVERRAAPVIAASAPLVLDCGEGVRLMGRLAEPAGAKRLAVLLHGWEGSSESLYVLSLAQVLFARGYAVLRLNLRDHGGTHALNRELFHSCRLPEVVGAVARLQSLYPAHRLSLAGFSLGGNFCLRVGAKAREAGIRIARIVAVCPVLDPEGTLEALERGPAIYHRYFMHKWRRSLRLKQAAWPGEYDFGALIADPSLRSMTERMVLKYTDYPDLASYLSGYAITGGVLEALEAPSSLVLSGDDPMIHARDLERIARPAALEVTLTPRGGHCGFMDALRGPSWIDRRIAAELDRA
jgi:uncharacterized protein